MGESDVASRPVDGAISEMHVLGEVQVLGRGEGEWEHDAGQGEAGVFAVAAGDAPVAGQKPDAME